jgi:hypothetical protein
VVSKILRTVTSPRILVAISIDLETIVATTMANFYYQINARIVFADFSIPILI